MRYSAILFILMLNIGCGDDAKKASASNLSSNNTAVPNPSGNNTSNTQPGSFELGNDNALISSLTVDVCKLGADYYAANISKSDICTLDGLASGIYGQAETDADARMKCQSSYDECMAQPMSTTGDCVINVTGCDEKVSVFESCIEFRIGSLKAYTGGLTCSNLTLESELQDVADSAECTLLETNCPALFGE